MMKTWFLALDLHKSKSTHLMLPISTLKEKSIWDTEREFLLQSMFSLLSKSEPYSVFLPMFLTKVFSFYFLFFISCVRRDLDVATFILWWIRGRLSVLDASLCYLAFTIFLLWLVECWCYHCYGVVNFDRPYITKISVIQWAIYSYYEFVPSPLSTGKMWVIASVLAWGNGRERWEDGCYLMPCALLLLTNQKTECQFVQPLQYPWKIWLVAL